MTRRTTRRRVLGAGLMAGVAALAGVVSTRAADPPHVEGVKVSQTNLARGNRFTVTVSITGDVRAATITYVTPRGGALTQTLRFTYGVNYEAGFVIANGAPVGVYRVDNIAVRDATDRVVLRLTASDPTFADLVRDASVTVTSDGNPQSTGQGTAAPLAPISAPTANATATAAPPVSVNQTPSAANMLSFVSTSVSQNLLAYGNVFTARVVVRGPVDTVRETYAYPGGETTHTMALDYTRGDESHYESTFTVTGDFPLGRYVVSRLYAEGSDGSVLDLSLPPDDALVVGSSVDVTADGNPLSAGALPPVSAPTPIPVGLSPVPTAPPLPTAVPPPPPPQPTTAPPPPTATALPPAALSAASANPIRFAAVMVSTPTVRPGASFLVTARIEDTVGNIVGQPVVSFSDGQRDLFAFFNRTASGVYRATVPVSQYYPEGTYALARLYAYDNAGNTLDVHSPDTAAFHSDIIVRR